MEYISNLFGSPSKRSTRTPRADHRYAPYKNRPSSNGEESATASPTKPGPSNAPEFKVPATPRRRTSTLSRGDAVVLDAAPNAPACETTEPDPLMGLTKEAARTPDGQFFIRQMQHHRMVKKSREMDERPPKGCEWVEHRSAGGVSGECSSKATAPGEDVSMNVESETRRTMGLLYAARSAAEERAAQLEVELARVKRQKEAEHARAERAFREAEKARLQKVEELQRLSDTVKSYNTLLLQARQERLEDKRRYQVECQEEREKGKKEGIERHRMASTQELYWKNKLQEERKFHADQVEQARAAQLAAEEHARWAREELSHYQQQLADHRTREESARLEEEARHARADEERLVREEFARLEEEARLAREEAARQQEEEARRAREEEARRAAHQAEEARRAQEARQAEEARAQEENEREKWSRGHCSLYESKWETLKTWPDTVADSSIPFSVLPWPTFRIGDFDPSVITTKEVREFISSTSRPQDVVNKTPKDICQTELIRYHPDKFCSLVIPKVIEAHKENAKAAADRFTSILLELRQTPEFQA